MLGWSMFPKTTIQDELPWKLLHAFLVFSMFIA